MDVGIKEGKIQNESELVELFDVDSKGLRACATAGGTGMTRSKVVHERDFVGPMISIPVAGNNFAVRTPAHHLIKVCGSRS